MSSVTQSSGSMDWRRLVSPPTGGAIGAYICFPFEALKKKIEAREGIKELTRADFHPRELYRGSASFAGSVAAATLIQMTAHRMFQSMPVYDPSSLLHEAVSSLTSGMLGAFFASTPFENALLTQQTYKVGPAKALEIMFKQGYTRPWVGLPELAMREAGFAGTMLCTIGFVKQKIFEETESEILSNAGGVLVGVGGAALTQPFDVLATKRQVSNGTLSSLGAVKEIYRKQGKGGFISGLQARVLLFVGCAMVIPRAEKQISDLIKKRD